jgi:hypothetical protein
MPRARRSMATIVKSEIKTRYGSDIIVDLIQQGGLFPHQSVAGKLGIGQPPAPPPSTLAKVAPGATTCRQRYSG